MNFIPPQDETRLRAAASGVLPNGKPVAVNADGTVSVVALDSASQALGSEATFTPSDINASYVASAFDSNTGKIATVYRAGNGYAYVVVGTVSGTDITFGTPVVMASESSSVFAITFDSNANKIVVFQRQDDNGSQARAYVGTISGTSVSFGSAVVAHGASTNYLRAIFDSNSNKVVFVYQDDGNSDYGTAVVGTVSGTSISFGTAVVFESASTLFIGASFDSTVNKVVIVYRDGGNSNYGTAIVGTVSGTDITFGSPAIYHTGGTASYNNCVYDSDQNKTVIVFGDGGDSNKGKARVGTISGTNISFGSVVTFDAASSILHAYYSPVYDAAAKRIVVSYSTSANLELVVGTVSETSISFETAVVLDTSNSVTYVAATFDSTNNKVITSWRDPDSDNAGKSIVFKTGFSNTNLTSENYIGMSGGAVDFDEGSEAVGSKAVFETATTSNISPAYDSNQNKTTIFYRDGGNSNHGTAIVATLSGTSLSYGSPVVFESAASGHISAAFDSNSNKIVIAYSDDGDSSKGTAIVGTVSGTSISFGSPVVFNTGNTQYTSVVFDSSNNKVVICYVDAGSSSHGTAIVGTVSGANISFGSEVVFESASTAFVSAAFDSNSNKVVVGYRDQGNSNHGTAIVGTVSGTSISFGSATAFESAAVSFVQTGFDSTNNKLVMAYQDEGNSYYGTAIVGTVSGTSISFGTAVVFQSSQANTYGIVYDSNAQKMVIFFRDQASSAKGTVIVGTISGTSISFNTKTVVNSGRTEGNGGNVTFDSINKKVVIGFKDEGNSNYGTAVAYQTAFDNTVRGQVASGSSASVDIIGTVSENQNELTAGQSYFVQTDGTIALTAGSPSVFAGTAISSTELLVKS